MAIVARNYVQQPRFPNGTDAHMWGSMSNTTASVDATTGEPFVQQFGIDTRAGASPVDGSEAYRAAVSSTSSRGMIVFLPDFHPAAGDRISVLMKCVNVNTEAARLGFGISWQGANRVEGINSTWVDAVNPYTDIPNNSKYSFIYHEFVVPETFTFKDIYGEITYLPAGRTPRWYIYGYRPTSTGNANGFAVSGARVDILPAAEDTGNDYFDGSMPPAGDNTYSWNGAEFESTSLADNGAGPIAIAPPAATFSDEPPKYTLPETTGATWLVDSVPTAPGAYTVEPTVEGVTVTVEPVAVEGYTFDPPAEAQQHTWYAADPGPDPGPDPVPGWEWPDEPTTGGKLVARWLKWDSEQQQRECSLYYEVVRSFVWGYTRGHGFDDDGVVPAKPLERVIVAAGARLAYNPEYVSRWTVSQESETMSVFQGFNLAEQAILNRYRRTWA